MNNPWLRRGRTEPGTAIMRCPNPECPSYEEPQEVGHYTEADTGAVILENDGECPECHTYMEQ